MKSLGSFLSFCSQLLLVRADKSWMKGRNFFIPVFSEFIVVYVLFTSVLYKRFSMKFCLVFSYH